MDLLLIGMSRFGRRRVLPAAEQIPEIETIHIVSSHVDAESLSRVTKLGAVYTDLSEALTSGRPGLAYISLVNSDHARAARRTLEHGYHVVVDKPGFPDQDIAEEMVSLARSSSLVIAEATCYPFHPLFKAIRTVLSEVDAKVTSALAVFTPPVPTVDWRYDRAKGGGALLDTGPYAVSLGRVLWGADLERIEVIVGDRTADALETSYSMLAGYSHGRTIVGQFGFTNPYQNMLRLMGRGCTIDVERPFSAPPDMLIDMRVRTGDQTFLRTVEPADSMQVFLSEVLAAALTGSQDFHNSLLRDAGELARLRRAAKSA